MKNFGYLLITVGFLAGSLVAVQTSENVVNWTLFAPALVVGAVGVALARIGVKSETQQTGKVTANIETLSSSIERVVQNMRRLDDQKQELHPYDVHGRIDELFPEDLTAFVDARQSIAHRYGLPAYAAIMNEFAAGERYLNRVWSASVDSYIDEVRMYLPRAREQFEKTNELIKSLDQSAGQADDRG
jgi:hypothetical protein